MHHHHLDHLVCLALKPSKLKKIFNSLTFKVILGVLLCFLRLKYLFLSLFHCLSLLLGEGATLDVRGEAAQLLQEEEGGLEGLLGPGASDPVTSCLNSALSRVVDTAQLGDYLIHFSVVGIFFQLLHWQ